MTATKSEPQGHNWPLLYEDHLMMQSTLAAWQPSLSCRPWPLDQKSHCLFATHC